MLDLAIIGGGPAGLSCGLYASRGGIKNVTLFEKGLPGGAIASSSEIENYPGIEKVQSGMEFMEPWNNQCFRFGLKHEMKEVQQIIKKDDYFILKFHNEEIKSKNVVVCTGSTPKRAGIKGEDEFYGRGVSNCATCDGFFYKDKEVAIIGGGDTALEEALYLTDICSKVYLIHRRDKFRAAPSTVEKIKQNSKIELILEAKVTEILGDNMGVNAIKYQDKNDNIKEIKLPGIFVFIGMDINNEVLKQDDDSFLCKVNTLGEIIVDLNMKTNIKGLYCAGDMRSEAPRQVVCAASDGATAALQVISSLH
ncbi:MAG TPA: thioredoxin-disulfide reductase [Campylobacterales bacterium]|nr:thioredoxin-disulfide reductase [Campylobacterales bacterium]